MTAVKVKPSEQVEGGGMDGAHIIVQARYEEFDYLDKSGQSQGTGVGLMLKCRNETSDDRDQFYRASDASRLRPSDDGLYLESVSGTGSLVKSSTCAIFLVELDNAGFNTEESNVNEDISEIEGLILDFQGKSLPKVSGGDRSVPMPAKLLALADEKNEWTKKFAAGAAGGSGSSGSRRTRAGGGGASKKKASKKAGSRRGGQNGSDVDIDALAAGYITKLMEEYSEIPRAEIADLVLTAAREDGHRKEIVERVFEEDFLSGYPESWEYTKKVLIALAEE